MSDLELQIITTLTMEELPSDLTEEEFDAEVARLMTFGDEWESHLTAW